jgi:aspartyl-tRNA(Asn)/glutamyl-tRNA(Gln) amidotransferase subunit A
LDSIGPIGHSVACCETLDALIANEPRETASPANLTDLRLGVPETYFLADLEPAIAEAFDAALASLSRAGARIETFAFPELERIPQMNARGTIASVECFADHRRRGLLRHRERYDPNVVTRIEPAGAMLAADYLDLLAARAALIAEADRRTQGFDAILTPTTPILAPRIDDVREPSAFARLNQLALRNPAVVNMLDRCAISLPMACAGPAPAGLMLIAGAMEDARLLAIAGAVETIVR